MTLFVSRLFSKSGPIFDCSMPKFGKRWYCSWTCVHIRPCWLEYLPKIEKECSTFIRNSRESMSCTLHMNQCRWLFTSRLMRSPPKGMHLQFTQLFRVRTSDSIEFGKKRVIYANTLRHFLIEMHHHIIAFIPFDHPNHPAKPSFAPSKCWVDSV